MILSQKSDIIKQVYVVEGLRMNNYFKRILPIAVMILYTGVITVLTAITIKEAFLYLAFQFLAIILCGNVINKLFNIKVKI